MLAAFLSGSFSAMAQQPEVRGKITDMEGKALPGAIIQIKHSKIFSNSNESGQYLIKLGRTLLTTDTLVVRLMGFIPVERPYTGTDMNFRMQEDQLSLNEVVVTALGIKREEKGLGYAVSKIDSKQITEAPSNNWVDGLKGKVAGLNIVQAGSGPINTARITLRGDRSLNADNNEALIVIDGVPMINGKVSSGVGDAYGAGASGVDKDIPIDFGNGLTDINPDDIESVSILKGAAATALYGSRAANGALIITTKAGTKNSHGIGVTFSSNSSYNDILKWPEFQYEYGQGNLNKNKAGEAYYSYGLTADGPSTSATSSAYGPKFDGQLYFQYDPNLEGAGLERTPWVPYTNNIKSFFRTGATYNNSLSLDGGNEKFTARASVSHTKNNWIMPNTGFERLVTSLNTALQLSPKLKLNAKFSYTNKQSDNLPGTGYNNQSISYFMIFQNPNVNLQWYAPMWKKGQEQVKQIHPYSSYIENPFLIAYEMTNSLLSNSLDGSLQGLYQINSNWDMMFRGGLNMRNDQRAQQRPFDTANFPTGYYKQQDLSFLESNTDALISYKNKLAPQLDIRASVGGNLMKNSGKQNNAIARGLTLPGVYKLSNALTTSVAENALIEKETQSIFGFVNLAWKNQIFLDITGRNDWSSTLPTNNRSYFYPSVSSSMVFSEMFNLPKAISFAKLRLSWAQVGNDADPYQTSKYYTASAFPGSAEAPPVLHNANLKPEISSSTEAGLNFALFKNRINADVNYYFNRTRNQILSVPLDITTGYSLAIVNGGLIQNQGIELMLGGKPLISKDFSWNSTLTWSKNYNKILALSEGVENPQQVIAQSGAGVVSLIATVGGSTGDLWGYGFERNEQGQVIFDAKTGLALRPNDITKIGNAYADWKAGFSNEFKYKNISLSVLVDGQYGGIVYSQSHHKMTEQGKLKHTLLGRETNSVVGEGVVRNADGSYSPNTTPVPINKWYADYYRRANVESNSFDASYLKLREVRIEYMLTKRTLAKLGLPAASIAFYGRDLAMISKFPMFDPETAALNGSTIMPGVEMGQFPSTRTFGINLKIKL